MKKLLSLLLSAVMVLSLAVPAFADTPTVLPMPKDALPPIISVDEAASLGVIGGADGPTAILTTGLEDLDLDSTLEELLQQLSIDLKEALGGVTGQVGVMVNGEYVQFPDAAPEVTDGRTMVPVRALVETLGGEVDYQEDTVTFAIDGHEYKFVIGSTTVAERAADADADTPEEVGTIEMDCAPYIKGGRTYVPIRFISEALGYDVGWDSAYQTVILLDREALAAAIDENFTILNRAQAAANTTLEKGESWDVDVKGGLDLTVFDTANGDQTYEADLACTALLNSEAFNGTYSVTFSESTVDALTGLAVAAAGVDDEGAELLQTVLTGLEDMEVIMTRKGMAWVHVPILDELSGEENVWIAADLGAELGALIFAEADTSTLGSVLVSMAGGNSVPEMAMVCWMANFMGRLYGDDKFTTSGGTSTLTIGVDELMALYEDMGLELDEDDLKSVWKEYNITMKVSSKGKITMTAVAETAAQLGVPTIKLTADSTSNGQKTTTTMKIHVANLGEMELKLTATQKAIDKAPEAEPPEDATIVKADEAAAAPIEP